MKTRIWLALIVVYIAWGSTYLAIRFAVETMPPFLMAAVRFLIAGAILFIWRKSTGDPMPSRIEWRSAGIVGLLLLMGGNGGVVWAEQRVASGVASLVVGAAPLWMVLMDALRPHGKKPTAQTLAGVLIGFGGIVLLIGPGAFLGGQGHLDLYGTIALLIGSFFWAWGSLYSRSARLPKSPLMGTAMEMLIGGLGLAALGSLTGEWGRLDLAAITPRSLWGLAYLITFGSLAGFAAYTWLLRVAPTPLVATYAYVNPLIAILIGNLLAAEPLTARILISTLVIVGSVALINTARPPAASQAAVAVVPSAGDD